MTLIAIVDDDVAVRDSLEFLLDTHGFSTQSHPSGEAFLAANLSGVDVALMDVKMPGQNGVDCLQAARASGVDLPIIMMSGHADVGMAVEAMKSGAQDFIEKPFEATELLAALGRVLSDRRSYLERQSERMAAERALKTLTVRETEVAHLLAEGKSNKDVARLLDISVRTVETHRAHILSKLNIRSTTQLVRLLLLD